MRPAKAKFIQIAVSTGADETADIIYALDEDGRVWWQVVAGSCLWTRLPDEREKGDA